MTIVNKIWPNL